MSLQHVEFINIVIVLFVLYRVIASQLKAQVIKFKAVTYLVLIGLGIYNTMGHVQNHTFSLDHHFLLFLLAVVLSATCFAFLRGHSYRIWVNQAGLVMRQGNWLTILWLLLGISIHILVDHLWNGSSDTILAYLGLTLLIQRGLVWLRAKAKFPEATQKTALYAQTRKARRRAKS